MNMRRDNWEGKRDGGTHITTLLEFTVRFV